MEQQLDFYHYLARLTRKEAGRQLANEIDRTESEIKKCLDSGVPDWVDRQDRGLDNRLNGIVTRKHQPINTYNELMIFLRERYEECKDVFSWNAVEAHGKRKFINYHAEKIAVKICVHHERCKKEANQSDRNTDIWIDGTLPMDVKFTIYPRQFWSAYHASVRERHLANHINNPRFLVEWYYKNQGANRWNWQNRLFIVCYDEAKYDHLALKGDLWSLLKLVWSYLDSLREDRLFVICQKELNGVVHETTHNGKPAQSVAKAGMIWHHRPRAIEEPKFLGGIQPIEPGQQLGLFGV